MTADRKEDVLHVLDRLVRGQRSELARLARREGLGAEDALDCVHDALCAFLQPGVRSEWPDGETGQANLLRGIVVNTARNKRRRHYLARPHRGIETIEPIDGAPSTEALVGHAEECMRLRSCVDQLCEPQRMVVMMRLLEERPGEDIASALGLTRGYVDVLLHRAKAALRVCMTEGIDDHAASHRANAT